MPPLCMAPLARAHKRAAARVALWCCGAVAPTCRAYVFCCCNYCTVYIPLNVYLCICLGASGRSGVVIDEHSKTEMLARNNKFECEACGSHQEAQKRIKVSAAPPCLILHLKRFKYIEQLQRCVVVVLCCCSYCSHCTEYHCALWYIWTHSVLCTTC